MKTKRKHLHYIVLALGISICVVGAFLMVMGESIVGPDHTGIATIVGIIGIGIIGTSGEIIAGARANNSVS